MKRASEYGVVVQEVTDPPPGYAWAPFNGTQMAGPPFPQLTPGWYWCVYRLPSDAGMFKPLTRANTRDEAWEEARAVLSSIVCTDKAALAR